MGMGKKLSQIDRRIIFLVIGLAVALPLLFPIGLQIRVSEPAQRMYKAIDQLPPGSKVLISFDYDPTTMPELYPMNIALVRHCFAKDLKVIGMALWPTGVPLGEEAFEIAAKDYGKSYGQDYVNLGYKAGDIVLISNLGKSIPQQFPIDFRGTPLEELPIMKGVRSLKNIDLVIDLSAGFPGIVEWTMIAGGRHHVKVGGGCTAVSAPSYYPYLQSKQIVGLLGGMKGAAEYETLMNARGAAAGGMDAQSIAHLVIILFIFIGNLFMFLGNKGKA